MTDTPTQTEPTAGEMVDKATSAYLEALEEIGHTLASRSGSTYSGPSSTLAPWIASEALRDLHRRIRKPNPEMVSVLDLDYSPKPGRAWR